MADSVTVTNGAATFTAATDETGIGHAQIVKLAYSGDGVSTLIGADANGLDVDVVRLPALVAGSAYVGKVVVGDGTNDVAVTTSLADSASNTRNVLATNARLSGYNGTSWDMLRSDVANGLDVDVTRLPALVAGSAYVGKVVVGDGTNDVAVSSNALVVMPRKDLQRIAVSTVDTGSASTRLTIATTSYSAGDQVYSTITLANAARASGGTGVITNVALLNTPTSGDVIGAYDVVFFRSAPSALANDNSAFSISGADTALVIAVVQLTGAFDLGNGRIAQSNNLYIPYDCSGGTNLFAALICRSTHGVFAAYTDLTLVVHVERN